MEELELTAKELLYAAAQLGVQTFYGLPDPFYGMDAGDIHREIVGLQIALERRGYATLGFEDAFSLSAQCSALLSVCARCDAYLVADLTPADRRRRTLSFYRNGGQWLSLSPGEELLRLGVIEQDAIAACIQSELDLPAECGEADNIRLSCEAMEEARMLGGEEALAALKRHGCGGDMAEVLLAGFRETGAYYSISMVDLKRRGMETLVCVRAAETALLLTPMEDDPGEYWKIATVNGEGLREALQAMLRQPASGQGGEPA